MNEKEYSNSSGKEFWPLQPVCSRSPAGGYQPPSLSTWPSAARSGRCSSILQETQQWGSLIRVVKETNTRHRQLALGSSVVPFGLAPIVYRTGKITLTRTSSVLPCGKESRRTQNDLSVEFKTEDASHVIFTVFLCSEERRKGKKREQ